MSEKIDIHKRALEYEKALENLKRNRKINQKNKELIFQFLNDCQLGKTIRHREKKKIGSSRCLRYLYDLRQISSWLNKVFDKVTQKDMEQFIISLEQSKFKRKDGSNYSERSKIDFKNTIKKFYKWLYGNNDHYPELVSWIETYKKEVEIPALKREEIERMVEQTSNIRTKAMLMLLFDSGARAEEFLNIRLSNIERKQDYYMIRIEHSKTKPRTISVPMCTKFLDEWLKIHPQKDSQDAQLFPTTYPNLRKILNRIGKKALNKRVYPHLMRHSSVTYYCGKLTAYKLCYRYGWSMSSKMPARYIDREGIEEQETAEIIKTDEITKLKRNYDELKEEFIRLKEMYEQRDKQIDEFIMPLGQNKEIRKFISREGLVPNLMRIKR